METRDLVSETAGTEQPEAAGIARLEVPQTSRAEFEPGPNGPQNLRSKLPGEENVQEIGNP